MSEWIDPDFPCRRTKQVCWEVEDFHFESVPGKRLMAWVPKVCYGDKDFLRKLKYQYGFSLIERGTDMVDLDLAFEAGWEKEEMVINLKGPVGLSRLNFAEDRVNALINAKYGVPVNGIYPGFHAVFMDEPLSTSGQWIFGRKPSIDFSELSCVEMKKKIEEKKEEVSFEYNFFYISWFVHFCLKTNQGLVVGEYSKPYFVIQTWKLLKLLNETDNVNWIDSVCYNSYHDSKYTSLTKCDSKYSVNWDRASWGAYVGALATGLLTGGLGFIPGLLAGFIGGGFSMKGFDQRDDWKLLNDSGFSGGRAFISLVSDYGEFDDLFGWANNHGWNDLWSFPGSDECWIGKSCKDFESRLTEFCKAAVRNGFLKQKPSVKRLKCEIQTYDDPKCLERLKNPGGILPPINWPPYYP